MEMRCSKIFNIDPIVNHPITSRLKVLRCINKSTSRLYYHDHFHVAYPTDIEWLTGKNISMTHSNCREMRHILRSAKVSELELSNCKDIFGVSVEVIIYSEHLEYLYTYRYYMFDLLTPNLKYLKIDTGFIEKLLLKDMPLLEVLIAINHNVINDISYMNNLIRLCVSKYDYDIPKNVEYLSIRSRNKKIDLSGYNITTMSFHGYEFNLPESITTLYVTDVRADKLLEVKRLLTYGSVKKLSLMIDFYNEELITSILDASRVDILLLPCDMYWFTQDEFRRLTTKWDRYTFLQSEHDDCEGLGIVHMDCGDECMINNCGYLGSICASEMKYFSLDI